MCVRRYILIFQENSSLKTLDVSKLPKIFYI
ncbi:MAG: hypothetical protein KKH01_01765 [Firmicutes bacterium]|nr:hypothetical protein [Bacillota bacterium]